MPQLHASILLQPQLQRLRRYQRRVGRQRSHEDDVAILLLLLGGRASLDYWVQGLEYD